jgi:hypothetical protein
MTSHKALGLFDVAHRHAEVTERVDARPLGGISHGAVPLILERFQRQRSPALARSQCQLANVVVAAVAVKLE